jgi:hypothetical protein
MKTIAIVVGILLASYSGAQAQFLGGEQYLTLGGGYAFGTLASSGKSIDGGCVGLNLDHRGSPTSPWSLAVTFGYSELDETAEDTAGLVHRTVTSWPLGLGAKAWFGESKMQGYVGGILTVYFSSLKTTTEGASDSYTAFSTSGWGLNVPIGVAYNISERTFITVGYVLNWLWEVDNVENDMIHTVTAGLGFQL